MWRNFDKCTHGTGIKFCTRWKGNNLAITKSCNKKSDESFLRSSKKNVISTERCMIIQALEKTEDTLTLQKKAEMAEMTICHICMTTQRYFINI